MSKRDRADTVEDLGKVARGGVGVFVGAGVPAEAL